MATRVAVLSALLALISWQSVFAQSSGTVKGIVIDATTSEPLPSATVMLLNASQAQEFGEPNLRSANGRIAKRDGTFEFADVLPGNYVLRVRYVGYKISNAAITVIAGKETFQKFALQPDIKGLDEVVVTGAAVQRFKSTAEVAVSRVDASALTQTNSYQDLSQLLEGKVAGVHVMPSSGNVGGGVRFDVRAGAGLFGSGQPVIFIDGVRTANEEIGDDLVGGQFFSSLADLNPDDIADIEVLKGPAASALYGTSGSNGVVLIKTKNGSGRRTDAGSYNFQYKATTGWNSEAQKYTADNALSFNDANNIFRTGPFTEHNLSFGGSSAEYKYYASFTNRTEDGIMYSNSLDRNSVRANVTVFPSDNVNVAINTNFTSTYTTLPPNDNNIFGYLGNTVLAGPTSVGGYGSYAFLDSAAIRGLQTSNRSRRFLGSVELNWDPIKDVVVRGTAGYDGDNYRGDQLYPANYTYSGVQSGDKRVSETSTDRINLDFSAAYTWRPSATVTGTTTLGTQAFMNTTRYFFSEKQQFPTQLVTNVGAGQKFISSDETFGDTREAGVFLAQDISVEDKYLFSAGVRNDYASSVGPDAPSIFYPRASAAVRLDKFNVLPEELDLFKIRMAYGQSGVLPGALDASALRWAGAPSGSGVGAVIDFIGNPAIQPERVGEFEIGLESEWKNSYGIDFTYYRQNASNSIVSFQNAPSTGLTASATPRNVGAIKGWGFETNIYGRPIHTINTQLDLNLILNYANNEVTSLGGAPPIYQDANAVVEGQPRAAFYTFKVLGALYDANGAYAGPRVDTVRSYIGTPVAPTTGSFTATFRFLHDFTLYALADWSLGGTLRNETRTFQAQFLNDKEYNTLITNLGLAASVGLTPDPSVPVYAVGSADYKAAAERFAQLDPSQLGAMGYYESSDFLRIREVSLRYDVTSLIGDLLTQKEIKSLTIGIGVRNLALFKKYKGPDVEVNEAGSARSIYRGNDFLTLQSPRTVYGTLSVGF